MKSIRYRSLCLSLAISAACLFLGLITVDALDAGEISAKLMWPLCRLMIFIGLGLVVGQTIEVLGWTRMFGALAGPVFRFANLNSRCSAAFTTAFISGIAANSMLSGFFKDGKISRRQLFLTNFINQFPAYFLHLPTTFFIVIPLTGRAGLLYFLVTFAATILRTSLFIVYGRLFPGDIPQEAYHVAGGEEGHPIPQKSTGILKGIREKIPTRVVGIAIYLVPIYTLIFVLNSMGVFGAVRIWLARYVAASFIPIEALSMVVISFAAEFTSGFAAAGALQNAGILSLKQTVLALLIGNVVAFPVRALRHQLPRYVGIFSPKMGTQLLLVGQGFRVSSLLLMGVLYYWLWP